MTRLLERAGVPGDTFPLVLRRYWSAYFLAALLALAWLEGGEWAGLAVAFFLAAWGVRGPAWWNLPRRAARALLRPDGAPRETAREVRRVLEAERRAGLPDRIVFSSWSRQGSWRWPTSEAFELKLWPGEHIERWQGRTETLRHSLVGTSLSVRLT